MLIHHGTFSDVYYVRVKTYHGRPHAGLYRW